MVTPLEEDITLLRARLDYATLKEKNPDWDHVMINDYLGISESNLQIVDQIIQNQLSISVNAEEIEDNKQSIGGLTIRVYATSSQVGANVVQISENTNNIDQNASDIADNASRIDDLEQLVNRVFRT